MGGLTVSVPEVVSGAEVRGAPEFTRGVFGVGDFGGVGSAGAGLVGAVFEVGSRGIATISQTSKSLLRDCDCAVVAAEVAELRTAFPSFGAGAISEGWGSILMTCGSWGAISHG